VTDWYVPLRPAGGDTRVVTFPHAGGGPASLATIAPLFPPHVEPWAVNLPGRQARLAEAPRIDLDGLVADLADALRTVPRPYVLFGYCSGALLAYLVARRVAPSRLVVGSFAAPDVAVVPRRLHALPSALFWDRLVAAGGLPADLARHTDLQPVLEPALRADFGMLAGYRHVPGPPLDAPVTVLYGRHDRSLTRGALLGWRRHTTTRPTLRELNASHWLLDDQPAEVATVIAEEIACDSATA
jgi:medium-chain acyl-[acyl-carrier-protein] hydrolase